MNVLRRLLLLIVASEICQRGNGKMIDEIEDQNLNVVKLNKTTPQILDVAQYLLLDRRSKPDYLSYLLQSNKKSLKDGNSFEKNDNGNVAQSNPQKFESLTKTHFSEPPSPNVRFNPYNLRSEKNSDAFSLKKDDSDKLCDFGGEEDEPSEETVYPDDPEITDTFKAENSTKLSKIDKICDDFRSNDTSDESISYEESEETPTDVHEPNKDSSELDDNESCKEFQSGSDEEPEIPIDKTYTEAPEKGSGVDLDNSTDDRIVISLPEVTFNVSGSDSGTDPVTSTIDGTTIVIPGANPILSSLNISEGSVVGQTVVIVPGSPPAVTNFKSGTVSVNSTVVGTRILRLQSALPDVNLTLLPDNEFGQDTPCFSPECNTFKLAVVQTTDVFLERIKT